MVNESRSWSTVPRYAMRFMWIVTIVVGLLSTLIVLGYGDYFYLGNPDRPDNDDVKYLHTARVLINDGVLSYNTSDQPSTYIMPGMPFVIAAFMLVFGQGDEAVIAIRLFQCLLQALCIPLIFWLAYRVFTVRTALIAIGISAIYLPDYFSSGVILSESIFRTLFLLLIIIMIVALEKRRTSWYLLVGLLVAIAAYFKPHSTLLPVIFLLFWWKQRYTWKEMMKYTAAIGLVFVILLSPWWIRNVVTFDKFVVFTESSGNPFLLGTFINFQEPDAGFYAEYPEHKDVLMLGSDNQLKERGYDMLAYHLKHNPLLLLYWFTIGKVGSLYVLAYYWKPLLGIDMIAVHIYQVILLLMGISGVILTLRKLRQWPNAGILLASLGYFTFIYIPFVAFSRYGYPNMFLLIIFAAFFLDRICTARYEKKMKQQSRHYSVSGGS
ncbi:ArnT family glycosyltransferase [Paenibacillus agilis]|uniref:Glycosyltransferase family 39 protein n=1 Tax=Paenibacillus agilis TaxID=3020863 RepID=A0A559J200_9BACL|nr:glycosyltransferase family 39 protein [Paenibacillus agilis]TVX93873.1 glycosyltransferase family 39 protein [Paenibacillus agilis]